MHLCDAAAVPLALQGVLARGDVPQTLGHQRIQDHMLDVAAELGDLPSRMVHTMVSHTGSLNFLPMMSSMGLPRSRLSSSTAPSSSLRRVR